MKENRYSLFINNFVQDFLLLIFFILLISLYRVLFIYLFRSNLPNGLFDNEVYLALWYGFRLSLKTAVSFCLPSFILGTLVNQIFTSYNAYKFRFIWAAVCVFILSLLFQTRIPYYQEFNVAFSPFIFNTFNDDVGAITKTAISQYNAFWRLIAALIISGILIIVLKYWLKFNTFLAKPFLRVKNKFIVILSICILIVPFSVFMRFGGSLSYKHSIYWKNSARLQTALLNEAILDDIQALYKARKIYKGLKKNASKITADQVKQSIKLLDNKEDTDITTLLPFFTQKAQGILTKKPSHIFVIVGETYMLWPLLEKYNNLPIANGLKRLKNKYDNVFLTKFLPSSSGTMFGLTSVLLGFPEVNLTTASRPTAQKPYETALSVQLKKLGYTPHFFYGGFPSWEDVGRFISNQGFEENYYYSSFSRNNAVWGVEDKIFLDGVFNKISEEPSFNLILTSSNHPPYVIDMTDEPVSKAEDLSQFLSSKANQKLMIEKMQNFEYADHYLASFVERVLEKFPDSLFVITGDHADRWTLTSTPTLQERIAVPLLIIGKGLNQKMISQNIAASHQDIAATVLDLVSPKGSQYFALGKSIFDGQDLSVGAYYWATADYIGEINSNTYEKLNNNAADLTPENLEQIHSKVKAYHNIASWRILKGTEL